MIKKVLGSFFAVMVFAFPLYASKTYVIDTPNANILGYGSFSADLRWFSHSNVVPKVNFGVFRSFDLGISWELDKFISNESVKANTPAFHAKFRLYAGNMILPAFSIGYDGQGTFVDSDGKYLQRESGLYFVIGKELFLEGLVFNLGININAKGYWFINANVPIYKEFLSFMVEYDNVNVDFSHFHDARLNCGLRLAVTECLDIDLVFRDCFGKKELVRVPNERVLKMSFVKNFNL